VIFGYAEDRAVVADAAGYLRLRSDAPANGGYQGSFG
jgi:hypothetical protein